MSQGYRLTPVVAGPPAKRMKLESDSKLQLVGSQNNLTMASGGQELSSSGSLNSTSSQTLGSAKPSNQQKKGGQKGAAHLPPAHLNWSPEIETDFQKWCQPYTYECKACLADQTSVTKVYTGNKYELFLKHLRKVHDLETQEYTEGYGCPKFAPHSCKICEKDPSKRNRTLIHDRIYMIKHFRQLHDGMTVQEYYFNHIRKEENPSEEDTAFLAWCYPGVYKCLACNDFESEKNSMFRNHIRLVHGMTLATYHGTYGATKIQHMCELCGNYIQHDYQLMQRHFSCTHKHLTVKEYFLKYVYKTQSVL